MFSALTKSLKSEQTFFSFQSNLLAGLTVGIIALPLSMALAIASGVAPQHGLYTSIIAGIITIIGVRVKLNPICHKYSYDYALYPCEKARQRRRCGKFNFTLTPIIVMHAFYYSLAIRVGTVAFLYYAFSQLNLANKGS